jgi:hypothetical protein
MARRASCLFLIAFALAGGCGATTHHASAGLPPRPPLSPWPSRADYATIKTAVGVRDHVLLRRTDWREKAYAAFLGLRTLLTVHMAAGSCATYVTELYGNLLDLRDAYPAEDWRPLVRFVRRQPSLAAACRRRDVPARV